MNLIHSAESLKAGRHYQHPSRSSALQKVLLLASRWLGLALATGSLLFAEPLAAAPPLAWGRGYSGQLGDGNFYTTGNTGLATPVQVSGLTSVTAIAAGQDHSLALKSDGTVWAWGNGESGQLGDGIVYTSGNPGVATPVQVSGLAAVTAIAAGGAGGLHSFALKSN